MSAVVNPELDYLYHHIFFPPQVPHYDDQKGGAGDRALLDRLIQLAPLFRDQNDFTLYQLFSRMCHTLRSFSLLHRDNKSLSCAGLLGAFRDVKDGEISILHLSQQNSGLILHKQVDEYIIEAFEASASSANVLSAQGALRWDFPSRAVAIPSPAFEDQLFQESLAQFLERASVEPVKQFEAMTLKAGSLAFESRDTTTPAIVGQLLMVIMEANGRKHTPIMTQKRILDEVCWDDGAKNPWRRSPAWLVLRVGLQRSLCFLFGGTAGSLYYKFFMCYFLCSISQELFCHSACPAEWLAFARTKLARRVAKLEQQKRKTSPEIGKMIDTLLRTFGNDFSKALRAANERLAGTWQSVRIQAIKHVPTLPRRADPGSTILSLKYSRNYVQRVMFEALHGKQPTPIILEKRSRTVAWQHVEPGNYRSVNDYLNLANIEANIRSDTLNAECTHIVTSELESIDTCAKLVREMHQYQSCALTAYKSVPENLSSMIINLLVLWRALDSEALRLYPLLSDYDPGFPRNLLYPLQVSELPDMHLLQELEQYLEQRRSKAIASLPSILDDLSRNSFAIRFFDGCSAMQELFSEIKHADDTARSRKQQELEHKSAEYEDILREAAGTACLFMEDEFDPLQRQHDDRRCRKHYLERKAARIRIRIHEALLPSDDISAKAVVFELLLPKGFAAWRDATWRLLQLSRMETHSDQPPQLLLREYAGLKNYTQLTDYNVTLASRTKSFQNTHYAQVPFPTALEQVCLPHGLKYGLYDREEAIWTSRRRETPSFANLCAPNLQTKSAYAELRKFLHPTFEASNPSGNEILAKQTRCPNSLTIAEYISFQELRLGTGIQWVRLLRELASSNLNFGTIETGALVAELVLMAGPPRGVDQLRAIHWTFRDPAFCAALIAQIKKRLESIAANWREGQTVQCLGLILQRCWSLTSSIYAKSEAKNLMLHVRSMTLEWTRMLRNEICTAVDVETAQKRSKDGLLAALLCRRTFVIEATHNSSVLQPEALACFLECGFTLKDSLPKIGPEYITKMPERIRTLFISDIKLVHRLDSRLRASVLAVPAAVDQAVNKVWAQAAGVASRNFTAWSFLPASHDGWITAKSTSIRGLHQQHVHIDIFEGTLLVDGQPLGRLPDEFTREGFFRQIFGNRVFLTYPSSIEGMSYMLAELFENHEIHFGFRNRTVFMRARTNGRLLELLPQDIFLSTDPRDSPDLPLPLIKNSVHWLDLDTQAVEIRPYSTMWLRKLSGWTIDFRTNMTYRRSSLLVDPRSSIFDRIASIFEPFESRGNMVIYQPEKKNISLRLPGLELEFKVNHEGLLESRQLQSVIDRDQDAGTLYGLSSSLVLRDCKTPEARSIIVAMGPASIEPFGGHVRVRIAHTGYYGRFFINRILGRLECASEPRLIYFKAYCHAVTGFYLPDPLTGRTGVSEAISCLRAGNAQPWAPIDEESYRILSAIARLSPRRIYYPEDLKVIQKVIWSVPLIPAARSDVFQVLVKDILHQCMLLHQFHIDSAEPRKAELTGDEHLQKRAHSRKQKYETRQQEISSSITTDSKYIPRDCASSIGTNNAHEVASLIKNWSSKIAVSHDITAILQRWPIIQGFDHKFELLLFADLINLNLASNWGSLFKLCQSSSQAQDRFKLMFLFATISFNAHIDMTVVRSLIAISIMEGFKDLRLPQCSTFIHFRRDQLPTIDYLTQCIKPHRVPYADDERALLPWAMHPKQRRKLENAQLEHEEESYRSCLALAHHMHSQWPCLNPSVDDISGLPLLDCETAFLAVKPEWSRLFNNFELSQHLGFVQLILNTCQASEATPKSSVKGDEVEYFPIPVSRTVVPTIEDTLRKLNQPATVQEWKLLRNRPNGAQRGFKGTAMMKNNSVTGSRSFLLKSLPTVPRNRPNVIINDCVSELDNIVGLFADSQDPTRRAYGQDLQKSVHSLTNLQRVTTVSRSETNLDVETAKLDAAILSASAVTQDYLDSIRTVVAQDETWLQAGALLPFITPVTLLERLPTSRGVEQDALITYAESLNRLQHLKRIRSAYLRGDHIQLATETTHENKEWESRDCMGWLLLELDFDLRIRRDQYEVAQAMLTPNSTGNFVLQMNMGQGKSSVIIPMLAVQLADGHNLVRIVVPRPLLLQTAQLLQKRLGGLLGRKIKHIPFSRKSPTDIDSLKAYHGLHVDILRSHGVILTLPEHILSFQLSGLQELSNNHIQQAQTMMDLQEWLTRKTRDILDECDHMLAVRTQLIYPSGGQSLVDAHPIRWLVVQDLLKLVATHLVGLWHEFPRSVEIINRAPGTFPTVYLLDPASKDALLQRLVQSILKGEGNILPTDGDLEAVGRFLREAQFPKALISSVAGVHRYKADIRQRLLTLRGLLIHRILLMGLSKRWNVQYGIDPRRDPIAVPFRSKGVPSDQAEFGHPDVSIILTCLSFYYAGLSLVHFQQCLISLLKSDEPAQEFELWNHAIRATFPESMSSYCSINVDDQIQCAELWKHLRQQVPVVNYFLNHFVFPRHARTFQRKLVSSGWDIAPPPKRASSPQLKKDINRGKSAPGYCSSVTVGFSGTNDNKTLLPLNVVQSDLPSHSHTNAEVLTYLLQPRNRAYFPAFDRRGKRLSENAFLYKLRDHGIRVLLDAGAQILELDNVSLVQLWLTVDYEAEAAVYFGEDGRARVIHRDGKSQPLAGSPYLDNLGSCLVYLDEAHTRGVDLKMPADSKAALTLGIMQTKDHTVQGQSLILYCPSCGSELAD